ncbi:ATP-dependent DNA helicase Rep [Thauera terpenica 58Eu]|jgi:ATP-dependent DNA helicase Rep|uniref:ATP-dependent DNA helicase Rep n=1 Tax=Thauera terpenica 58Eu TaxID=1348657 RepID=S9ZLZ2_9RHOO|nr:UvrD-helicase domain-containing protein [Thauera terpenica]EPZ14527.1 ATP-dependent DNA helicase Rep [Thauera terpenica 58Eu]MBP6762034.1 UvrD-helicase domain-containing protein [Thauera sp.]
MSALLNAPQREAIRYLDGPCLVLAGAGSGKTRVITHKIAHLINECGLSPNNIAAITFTNKAAKEMQERVAHIMGGRTPGGLTLCTFHALGVRIIRQEAAHCGLKPQFSILDASDTVQIVSDVAGESDKGIAKQMQWQISSWKNAMISPDEAAQLADNEIASVAAQLYREYERTLRAYQAVDFDDLISLPVRLFEEHPEVRERWQNRLRYLLVDEYQDTNRAQYRLLKLLSGVRGAFTAVGDDDQAIYAWRGADVENLKLLQQDYPKLKVIKLEQNYRSSRRILTAANTVIANNAKLFDKRLWSEHGTGDQVVVTNCRDAEHEAEWVATKIAAHKFEHRTRFKDYAILYRGNHQARIIEQQLRNNRIPYVMSGGQSFFDKAEIRDLIAYLRLLVNEDDDLAFIRAITTPRRGIGAGTLEALGAYAGKRHIGLFAAVFEEGLTQHLNAKQLQGVQEFSGFINRLQYRAPREPAAQLLEDLLGAIQYEAWLFEHCGTREAESKWNNVRDFVGWLGKKGTEEGKNLLDLTQTIALISMLDKEDPDFDGVQMATLHASKGLEFPHVFLVGVEEGLLPHQSSIDEDKIEEERRLMYVGITRAQRSLNITWCERRKSGREFRACEPSRFIAEMGEDIRTNDRKTAVPVSREEGKARVANLMAMFETRGKDS